jgi:hypothetical protein
MGGSEGAAHPRPITAPVNSARLRWRPTPDASKRSARAALRGYAHSSGVSPKTATCSGSGRGSNKRRSTPSTAVYKHRELVDGDFADYRLRIKGPGYPAGNAACQRFEAGLPVAALGWAAAPASALGGEPRGTNSRHAAIRRPGYNALMHVRTALCQPGSGFAASCATGRLRQGRRSRTLQVHSRPLLDLLPDEIRGGREIHRHR